MILARDYKAKPLFGLPIKNKDTVLAIMRSYEPNGISEGYYANLKSGEYTKRLDCGYEIGDLFWREEDIYNLDVNDLILNDDFIQALIEMGPADNKPSSTSKNRSS